MSYKTATDLKLIKIIQTVTEKTTVDARKEFPKLFGKLGRPKDFQVKLKFSEKVKLMAQRHRRIPVQMRKTLEAELTRLKDLNIIERVKGPTPWVSPIVITQNAMTNERCECVWT